jgi:exodeoxyribonuclease V alpha subunit
VQVVVEHIPAKFGLDALRDIQVLSPVNRDPAGVSALNEHLQEKLIPRS